MRIVPATKQGSSHRTIDASDGGRRSAGTRTAFLFGSVSAGLIPFAAVPAMAVCEGLPGHGVLRSALIESVEATGGSADAHLDIHVSATVSDADGTVCAVDMSIVFGGNPAGETAGHNLTSHNRASGTVGVLPFGRDRIAVGTGFAASGIIRKDPPLTTAQLNLLRRRAVKQGF